VSNKNTAYQGEDGEVYLAARQSSLSDYVQGLRASLFQDLGGPERTILDFGCGSGGLLKRIQAKRRIGIEIGEAVAALARNEGIDVAADLSRLPTASVDIAISFHALEHVERPIDVLLEIGRVTKPEGHIRIVVPSEMATHPVEAAWRPNRDRHLYTWTPLLLGNLADRCGYREIRTTVEPMPTKSRLVRYLRFLPPLAREVHRRLAIRRNALNVILDAKPPSGETPDRRTSAI
jgi:SAM-dependent methyltransferase